VGTAKANRCAFSRSVYNASAKARISGPTAAILSEGIPTFSPGYQIGDYDNVKKNAELFHAAAGFAFEQ
jgi:hypothetical protein